MRIVCAWCGKDIGEKKCEGEEEEEVTHGLCEKCFARLEAERKRKTGTETEPDET